MPWTNFLRNKVHDWLKRGQAYTPPTSIWIALVTTTPSPAVAGTELTAVDYGRVELPCNLTSVAGTQGAGTTAVSSGTSGEISNNIVLDYGTAASNWGTVTYWEAYDAETGGNRLEYGQIVDALGAAAPRSILAGDPVAFPASTLKMRIG